MDQEDDYKQLEIGLEQAQVTIAFHFVLPAEPHLPIIEIILNNNVILKLFRRLSQPEND